MGKERIGIYPTLLLISLLGAACIGSENPSPSIDAIASSSVSTPIPEATPIVLEPITRPYLNTLLGFSVWDIMGGDYYQALAHQDGGVGNTAIKYNKDLITIRTTRDDVLREDLDTTKVLAYMYNWEGLGNIPISSIDSLVDSFAPGGTAYLDFRALGMSRPSIILTANVSLDDEYVYYRFKNMTENKDHWALILRLGLFRLGHLGPDAVAALPFPGQLLHFIDGADFN